MAGWGAQALAVSHWTVVGDAASEQDGAEGSRLKSRLHILYRECKRRSQLYL